jgi:hypothetical protein
MGNFVITCSKAVEISANNSYFSAKKAPVLPKQGRGPSKIGFSIDFSRLSGRS